MCSVFGENRKPPIMIQDVIIIGGFSDLLDAGCGPAPMISLLAEKYPERHYTGLDLTPAMIEQAKMKQIPNAEFVVGDCENFPFEENAFDAIICSNSFHHYPNPQAFSTA